MLFSYLMGQDLKNPQEIWAEYDPDKGAYKEEIIKERTNNGVYYKESYISAYVLGEEVRVYCLYSVKSGIKKAPGLMNIHGWMSKASIDKDYIKDGWAVISYDYCGKTGNRKEYTKYPEALKRGNMEDRKNVVWTSHPKNNSSITQPEETSDYVWYALQRRVLSYFLTHDVVDASRIGAKGYSYGGTIIWNLGMDERVKAIVAYFGIGWNEYYRRRGVFKYKIPYVEPEKTSGEKIYLKSIAPQAHAPYIKAASLWLNGTNDHHGGHERGEDTFDDFKEGVPWAFAHQARAHHNTDKLGDNTKIWLKKHVLGEDLFWPKLPEANIELDAEGVPEFKISPDSTDKLEEIKIFYALKNPISYGRSWRDSEAVRSGDQWTAKLPVLNVDDYVFAFAQLNYKGNIVITSKFQAAIPSKLGQAIATDKPRTQLDSSSGWNNSGPIEGVGGIKGFRPMSNRGTLNQQFADPALVIPKNTPLTFDFYCTQPQKVLIEVNKAFQKEIEITASNDWQSMTIPAAELINKHNKKPLNDWSETEIIKLTPARGSDITKVVFAKFRWQSGSEASEDTASKTDTK